jgi:D-alanyl-D-alanine carboxypeptidase
MGVSPIKNRPASMIIKRMKSIGRATASAIVFSGLVTGAAKAGPSILFDAQTGKVISQEDAFQRWYPASLTKLMTAYIALKSMKDGKLTQTSLVKISSNAAKQPPSRMGYKPGNVLNLDNALKIMLVKSANDIAVAVGETVGGKDYVKLMNSEAKRLGMTGSNWINANGLHSVQNYTTARDLGILTYALRSEFPEYASYFGIEAIQYGEKVETNYNILLGRFAGADGMKTGFVCASGFNLVASATRDGRTLVAVVLGEKSQERRAEKAADMLAKGFAGASAGGATLADLPSSGVQTGAIDMRSTVCTEGAEADRWDGREVEGKMVLNSPHIKAMTREPNAVLVGLGNAGSKTGSIVEIGLDDLSRIPIPTPRPNQVSQEVAPMALTGKPELRKGVTAPAASN